MNKARRDNKQRITSAAIMLICLTGLLGCGGDGGGSGDDSGSSTNAPNLTVESVQMGLPVVTTDDDGAINGIVYPGNSCEMFVTLDPSSSTEQKSIWMRMNVSGATITRYEWEIVDWQSPGASGELSYYDNIIDIDSGLGVYKVESTNNYVRYDCPVGSVVLTNHIELVKVSAWTEDGYFSTAYFNLRLVSNRRLFVVGDSISTIWKWPRNLAFLSGRHTFSQSIGGSTSPLMVGQAQGVELAYPIPGVHQVQPGVVQVRWHRHIAHKTSFVDYRSQWPECAKAVSEPDTIKVYQDGNFIGFATRDLRVFSTDYSEDQKRIYSVAHGLNNGDRVVFISRDLEWPSDLSVLNDFYEKWRYSSPDLPSSLVERRVYFVANATTDSFELKELQADSETLDIGSDSFGSNLIECGWRCDVSYSGGTWDLSWHSRTKYDDLIWLLEVSANDFPYKSASEVTIPNTEALLQQMGEQNQRFILICPPSGSPPSHGPGSFNWVNYYDTYLPWVKSTYPNNHIDTMALLDSMRTQSELSLLIDPETPELLWISGDPLDESTWVASTGAFAGATQMWVGPGYIPLQFRNGFSDGIHLNASANQVLTEEIMTFLNAKGW